MQGNEKRKKTLNFFSKSSSMIVGYISSDGGLLGMDKGGNLVAGTSWQCILFGTEPSAMVVQVPFSD